MAVLMQRESSVPPTRFLARDGGRIAYELAGEGPLVVCVPGMGQLRSSYRLTLPALAAAGLRVAAMDLRGHGDSDATFARYDDPAAGADVVALVRQLGGPALLVGSSMGAAAAVWAAAECPDLVAGLVLIGPFVRDVPTGALARLAQRVLMGGPWAPAAWATYLPRLYPGRLPDDFAADRSRIVASMRRPAHSRAFRLTTRTSHAPVAARLGEVRAPVLVVMGGADPDFRDAATEARWVAERLGGEAMIVPGAGHYPHVERPQEVNPAILTFAARVLDRA